MDRPLPISSLRIRLTRALRRHTKDKPPMVNGTESHPFGEGRAQSEGDLLLARKKQSRRSTRENSTHPRASCPSALIFSTECTLTPPRTTGPRGFPPLLPSIGRPCTAGPLGAALGSRTTLVPIGPPNGLSSVYFPKTSA